MARRGLTLLAALAAPPHRHRLRRGRRRVLPV